MTPPLGASKAAICGAAGGGAAKVTRQDNLVHWWKLDDSYTVGADSFTSDSVDEDSGIGTGSGGATLSLQNGAAVDTSIYRFGTGSLALDGNNDFAANLNGVTELAGAYTWSCWYRSTGLGSLDGVITFDVDTITDAATMVGVLQHSGSGTYRFYHAVATGADVNDYGGGTGAVNDWMFLAQTWDGSTVKRYRANTDSDEGEEASPDPGVTEESSASASSVQAGIDSINLGMYFSTLYTAQGNIDDVRLYNVALTAAEIGNVYGIDTGGAGLGDFP